MKDVLDDSQISNTITILGDAPYEMKPSWTSVCPVHHRQFTAEAVKRSEVRPGWSCRVQCALLMPQADYFSTVITLSSPLCRSGLWGLMDTAMYNSLIISIQFDN